MKKYDLSKFNIVDRFSNWAIKDYLDSVEDPFEQAKIRLTFNLALLDGISVALIIIQALYNRLYFSVINGSIVLTSILVIFAILKYKKNVRAASISFTVVVFTAISIGAFFNKNHLVICNLLYFTIVILYSFFTLGKKWGVALTLLSIVVWLGYMRFIMYGNLHNEIVYTNSTGAFSIFIGFIMTSYIVVQFVNIRSAAEKEIRKNNEELKAAKELVDKTLEIQEQFLANTSHEVRTPLNGIIGMTRQLIDTPLSLQQKNYLDAVKTSSDNLLHIINDILDICKIRSNKIEFEKTDFSLAGILNMLQTGLEYKTKEKNIYLEYSIDESVPRVLLGDPVRLYQVLLNLTSNAVKFTEAGGVTIHVKNSGSHENVNLEFQIKDSGIGIAENKLQYIFENFTQAEVHTNRKYGGTGLGLSISKSLIEQQGGSIHVSSILGSGSVFTFHLSFTKGNPAWVEEAKKEKANTANLFNEINFLVVDDNLINQQVILSDLKKFNASIDVADNGNAALDLLSAKKYDLVFMDLYMPEKNGLEVTEFIRKKKDHPNAKTPVIAITASATSGEKERCFGAGMNDYLSKPFNPDLLVEKIQKWVSVKATTSDPPKRNSKTTDLNFLFESLNGNFDEITKLIQLYLKTVPGDLENLNKHFENLRYKNLWEVCHKLKQSVNFVGASEIVALLSEVESEARKNTPDHALLSTLIENINNSIEFSFAELKEF